MTKNGTFLPRTYKEWREAAYLELILQKSELTQEWPLKSPLKITVIFRGKYRGDGDNMIGSILDALVSADIIEDDSIRNIPIGQWEYFKAVNFETAILLSDV